MRQIVVLAGGLGTRVVSLTGGRTPKAMLDVAGRPFIDRKIEELHRQGADEIVLLTGHGSAFLSDHIARSRPPVPVRVIEDGPELLGTAGAVRAALDGLEEQFWLTYGDTFLEVPLVDAERLMAERSALSLMTVLHNCDQVQPSNTSVADGRVVGYAKGDPPGTHEWIDYGMLLFRRSVFEPLAAGTKADLGVVVRRLVTEHQMLAFEVTEPFYDIGTPEALAETAARFSAGR